MQVFKDFIQFSTLFKVTKNFEESRTMQNSHYSNPH